MNTEIDITDETDVDKEAGETNTPIIKENEDIPDIVEGLTEKKEDEDAINEVTTGQAIEYIDRIYDIATGEGIESVDVTAENKTTGDLYNCLSDNEGYFKLSLVAGDYKLILKRAGYKEKMVDINVK
ncbi:carboxypeptidase-like regulatory domain-containing protein [Ruminiclostridium josui]|uniref:carboxypeptidase-like regulatory domain-containing protein n=1 Tax=Ruminiclostridium josui TaxID=1499 RepID=UPI0006CF391E|nr:carboxypeptidase-like regulatory domain-containing protein [Ruminiclostridium josui]